MDEGVGDMRLRGVDARPLQGLGQDAAGGADERFARPVFLVARLLAHEHELGGDPPGAEDRLRGVAPEAAVATTLRLIPQPVEGARIRLAR